MSHHDTDASFLAMPKDLEKRSAHRKQLRWEQLTVGGVLFKELCPLVLKQASDDTFDSLRRDLEKWREVGKHQWEIARHLLDVAQQAAVQPAMGDQQLDRAAFHAYDAQEWDAFCALRGMPRLPIPRTHRRLSILLKLIGGEGALAVLEVELVDNGRGEIYADPQHNAFIKFGPTFQQAYQQAWEWAQEDAVTRGGSENG